MALKHGRREQVERKLDEISDQELIYTFGHKEAKDKETIDQIIKRIPAVGDFSGVIYNTLNVGFGIEDDNEVPCNITRIDDLQYYRLRNVAVPISIDYLVFDRRKEKEFTFSRLHAVLNILFGESSMSLDDWKQSFKYSFLIEFKKDDVEYHYLLNIYNARGSLEFAFYKITDDTSLEKGIYHQSFNELTRREMAQIVNRLMYFLLVIIRIIEGRSQTSPTIIKPFIEKVESNLIVYGYDGKAFFDYHFDESSKLDEFVNKQLATQRINAERNAALDDLTRQSQESGMGY